MNHIINRLLSRLKQLAPAVLGLVITIGALSCSSETQRINVIPLPNEITVRHGYFEIDSVDFVRNDTVGPVVSQVEPWRYDDLGEEGYELEVTHDTIRLTAATDKGIFYGRQTLRQLVSSHGIPCVEIRDIPRFAYRGLHVDVSRHFFSKQEIMKLMDEMARYKLNRFHFHLTDNGGWRIQLDRYPLLTSLGAFRTQCDWLEWWDKKDRTYLPEGTPGAYGGYYTKDDIRQIIAHADSLYIEVIPEIEFPAHSDEVFIGYPELCCNGKPYSGGEFCVGNRLTYTFIENVLDEIIELFPSRYIHIGGDEARKAEWKTCRKCNALMREKGMTDYEQLQHYLISYIEDYLVSRGKVMMGWDEIAMKQLHPTTTVLSYRGQTTASMAANKGYNVIFTPGAALYFDWYQATPDTQPRAMQGYSPIKKMYMMTPVAVTEESARANEQMIEGRAIAPDSIECISPGNADRIIGVQGCAWAEFINDEQHLEYMIFPRLLAIAEMAWTQQERREWPDFKPRMNAHIPLLQARGINTFTLTDEVELTTRRRDDGTIEVILDTEKYPAEIRYTLDGTEPSAGSLKYERPFTVSEPMKVKAAMFSNGLRRGPVTECSVGLTDEIHNYFPYREPEHWKNVKL